VGQGSQQAGHWRIRATHSDPAKIQLCRRAGDFFHFKETYGIDIEWDRCGYSYVAYTPREEKILKDLLPIHKKAGIENNWYDASDYIKIVPDINPIGLLGGTFSPGDGSASPLLANHAFFTKAKELGAEFHFDEPVKQIKMSGNKITGVVTNHDNYSCSILLNAAGAWASDIGKLAGVDFPVRPDSHEAAITEPVARFLGPMIVDIRPAPALPIITSINTSPGRSFFASLQIPMPGDTIPTKPAAFYPW
jgi:sarcosine oxidase subunit beta